MSFLPLRQCISRSIYVKPNCVFPKYFGTDTPTTITDEEIRNIAKTFTQKYITPKVPILIFMSSFFPSYVLGR